MYNTKCNIISIILINIIYQCCEFTSWILTSVIWAGRSGCFSTLWAGLGLSAATSELPPLDLSSSTSSTSTLRTVSGVVALLAVLVTSSFSCSSWCSCCPKSKQTTGQVLRRYTNSIRQKEEAALCKLGAGVDSNAAFLPCKWVESRLCVHLAGLKPQECTRQLPAQFRSIKNENL